MPKRKGAQVTIPEPYEDIGSLYRVAVTTKELVEVLAGQRGDPGDRAVTYAEFRPPDRPKLAPQPAPVAETWHPFAYVNGWVDYGVPFAPAGYRKFENGLVLLKGLVMNGTAGPILTLPVGYRPGIQLLLVAETATASGVCRLDITPAGSLYHTGGSNGWLSLNNIIFFAEN